MEENYREKSIVSKLGADSKFVGIMNIVLGVLNCLTISGIITGVIMIITGMRAKEAGDHFQNYSAFGDETEEFRALESLGKYFTWMKISIIVGIVLIVIFFLISFFMGSMIPSRSNSYDYSL